MSRLIILTGPSCVGKSPLAKALKRVHPILFATLQSLVLYNTRAPRPHEQDGVDYHFRSRAEIEALGRKPGFRIMEARTDLQAISLSDLDAVMTTGRDPFFEGNPFVAAELAVIAKKRSFPLLSVFLSPLSHDEVLELTDRLGPDGFADAVASLMKGKLIRRTQKEKGSLSETDLRDIDVRARSALREIAMAWRFQHVIPNHDGEDSDNWDLFELPLGDARLSLQAFVALLRGHASPRVERWKRGFVRRP
ncbi:MAG: hypothetical protein V2A58_00270 [Planctomycetota bacterium]